SRSSSGPSRSKYSTEARHQGGGLRSRFVSYASGDALAPLSRRRGRWHCLRWSRGGGMRSGRGGRAFRRERGGEGEPLWLVVRTREVRELLEVRLVVRLRAVRDGQRALREEDGEEHVGNVSLLLVRRRAVGDRTSVREA